jgi:hypothetical protein
VPWSPPWSGDRGVTTPKSDKSDLKFTHAQSRLRTGLSSKSGTFDKAMAMLLSKRSSSAKAMASITFIQCH